VVREGVERSAHRPPGEEDVIDKHHRHATDLRHRIGALHDRRMRQAGQVVAVEGDVQRADRWAGSLVLLDQHGQPSRQRDATAADANQHQVIGAAIALDDLVRDAGQRAAQVVRPQDPCLAHGFECTSSGSLVEACGV
jgi:hypothetical protein